MLCVDKNYLIIFCLDYKNIHTPRMFQLYFQRAYYVNSPYQNISSLIYSFLNNVMGLNDDDHNDDDNDVIKAQKEKSNTQLKTI